MSTIKIEDLPERPEDEVVDAETSAYVKGGASRNQGNSDRSGGLTKKAGVKTKVGMKGFGETTGDSPSGF